MIEFLLNQEPVRVDDSQADLTVLEYLRNQRHLTGTKEGCASGDCGACTAVLGSIHGDTIEYRHFNSCITFLGAIHGKQLITVDHLKQKGKLHATQKAMVDHHGSQCGFCTPGFIMSLFALQKDGDSKWGETEQKHKIDEYLAGNLCRCTGYRPIIDAAKDVLSQDVGDQYDAAAADTAQTLTDIGSAVDNKNFFLPDSAEGLAEILSKNPGTRLLGGGTDLALEVTQQLRSLEKIAYVGNITELKQISEADGEIRIGSAVDLLELELHLGNRFPELVTLLHRFGSRQVRGQATIGGNIANASPIGDLPPVLIALNASLELQDVGGRRCIPVEDFFLDYRVTALASGEFIREIIIPVSDAGSNLKIYKISKRIEDDISAVCLACQIAVADGVIQSASMAFGGMAAIPKRAAECERCLAGKPFSAATLDAAQEALSRDFQPIDDVRASATYRLQVAKNLLQRLRLELSEPDALTQVASVNHGY